MLANSPISFKVGLLGLTAQSTMEAELVAAMLTMTETVFCKGMIQELGFKDGFDSVPLFIDSASALHVARNRTYSPRAKHSALRYFFHPRAGRGRHVHHPLREDASPTCWHWDQAFQQATSPGTYQQNQIL